MHDHNHDHEQGHDQEHDQGHDQGHGHAEIVIPAFVTDPRLFSEVETALNLIMGEDVEQYNHYQEPIQIIRQETERLNAFAGLARRFVHGDTAVNNRFTARLVEAGEMGAASRVLAEGGTQVEPSGWTNYEPVFDLLIGAALKGIINPDLEDRLSSGVINIIEHTLPTLDYLDYYASGIRLGVTGPEEILGLLDDILEGRPRPKFPNDLQICLGEIGQILGRPGGALDKSVHSVEINDNTNRITTIQPGTSCAGLELMILSNPANPFSAVQPVDVTVFFAPCGVEGAILEWHSDWVRVVVPTFAKTGRVYFGKRSSGPETLAEVNEAKIGDFQAIGEMCGAMGVFSGAMAHGLGGFYSGLPMTLCPDQLLATGMSGWVIIEHAPVIGQFFALNSSGGNLNSSLIEACSMVTLQWKVESDIPTQVSIESGLTVLASGLPLIGTTKIPATASLTLTAKNHCGVDRLALTLNTYRELHAPRYISVKPNAAVMLEISASCPVSAPLQLAIANSDPTTVSAPAQATIAAGSNKVTIQVSGITAGLPEQPAAVLAISAPGYTPTAVGVWVERPAGLWSLFAPALNLKMIAIHAALLRTGQVLFFSGDEADVNNPNKGKSCLWNPLTGTHQNITWPAQRNMFCAGQCLLPDGRVLVAGGQTFPGAGTGADYDIHTFDPMTGTWSRHGDMSRARWYPTCVLLPNGQALIISGYCAGVNPNPGAALTGQPLNLEFDLFDPATGTLNAAPASSRSFLNKNSMDLYPFLKVLPGGALFVHVRSTSRLFFPDPTSTAVLPMTLSSHAYFTNSKNTRTYAGQGACVLLPIPPSGMPLPVKLLIVGGGDENKSSVDSSTLATNTAEIFDFTPALSPSISQLGWRQTTPMNQRRFMSDAVLLPDGKVLVLGGSAAGEAFNNSVALLGPELFDPKTETWELMDNQTVPRQYHSVALLLPDGRVVSAGSTGSWPAPPWVQPPPAVVSEKRVEVFSPPYLFRGPRPGITSQPNSISYGQSFNIGVNDETSITTVELIRPAAVTHTNDMDQRIVELSFVQQSAGVLSVTAPPDSTFAPPGYYMLFVVNSQGIPSIGKFLHIA